MYNEKSLGKVVLENVRANINSLGVGMKLVSSNIKLKNAEASRNGYTGISITASDEEVEVKIEGTTVVRNNGNHGIMFRAGDGGLNPLSGNMKVGGKTYIYGNVGDGLRIPNNVHVNVEMGRSGTLYSCDNVYRDVFNNGDGKFDEKRVTCGSQEGTGDLPGCTEAQCSAVECPAP